MSRQAQLPPRCPFQKRTTLNRPIHDSAPSTLSKDTELYPRHHKSISQSSILEDHPAWLDDLLSDADSNAKGNSNAKGIVLCRSASDPVTLLDGLLSLPSRIPLNNDKKSVSGEVWVPLSDDKNSVSGEAGNSLESACMYGPNSPRAKGKTTLPENALIALSEYVSQNPMQFSDQGFCISGTPQFDSVPDAYGSAAEVNAEKKTVTRHSGQRSRVRKLQYIAELERTVYVYQSLESELAVRVASVIQERSTLSMENSKLKQQLAKLQREKLLMDAQYQSLRKEVERLKTFLAYSPHSKASIVSQLSSRAQAASSEITWQMLDIAKLDLNSRC